MPADTRRFLFSDRKIDALPTPAAGRVTYIDLENPALQLRISATGSRSFSVLKRSPAGKLERLTLGKYPKEIDLKRARLEAGRLVVEIRLGANPAEARRALRGEPTLREFFAQYMAEHARPHKRSADEDAAQFRRYLDAPLGARKLSTITDDVLRAWHRRISKTAPAAANQALALVSTVFEKAREWKIISAENPARGVRKNPKNERSRFLSGDELRRFFEAVEHEQNPDYRHVFQLALLSGARRGNVLEMRWTDLDLQRATWHIPTTKNGQPLSVPLPPAAVAILAERERAGRFVFPSEASASGHLATVSRAWRRLLDHDELLQLVGRIEAAGEAFESEAGALAVRLRHARAQAERLGIDLDDARLVDLTPHDLRRSNGSWQTILGASLQIVGRSLGHKSARSTQVYSRLSIDPVRASIEAAASTMLAQRNGEPAEIVPLDRAS